MAKVKCEPGFTQLPKLNILDERKLTVAGAEVEIINPDHFTTPIQATFDTANSFSMTGNHTEEFQIGRRVQLDSGQSDVNCNVNPEDLTPDDIFTVNKYDYSIITAIQYDGVITDVTISDSILTSDLEEAGVEINWNNSQAGLITTTDLINSSQGYPSDYVLETNGFYASGDGGSAKWIQNGVIAQPLAQSPSQTGDALLNDANGNQWVLVESMPFVKMFGVIGDDSTDDTLALQAACTGVDNLGLKSLYFDDVICKISSITTSVQFIGDSAKTSIIHHDGIAPDIMITASGGSGRTINMYNMGLWGAGFNVTWLTNIILLVTDVTRGWDLQNCEIGRYAVNGYGAEIGLKVNGFAYYKNVVNTHFDYHKHAIYTLNNGNDLGRQFTDCRIEHCQGYAAVLVGNGGAIAMNDCALQFNEGCCVATEVDTVDDVLKELSGNTAFGTADMTRCTFERNNRSQYTYNLDATDVLIGYVSIFNGVLRVDDGFVTATTGEDGQFVMVDTSDDVTMTSNRCSASQIVTFLKGGVGCTGTVLFRDNLALGAAITTQYDIANGATLVHAFDDTGIVRAGKFYGSYRGISQLSSSNLNPANDTDASFINCTGGNRTVNLANVTHEAGRKVTVSKDDASVNTLAIVSSGSLINGVASYVLTSAYESATLISNGVDWRVIT